MSSDAHRAGSCPGCTPTQELLDELEARGVLKSWSKRSLCSPEELVSYASAEPISRVVAPPAGPMSGGGDPSAEASPVRFHPDGQFISAEQMQAAAYRAMESIRKKAAVDDFTTKVMSLGPEQGALDGLLALAAADVPPEQMRRLASDWVAGRLATDPEPAESVTVSLPRDVVEAAWGRLIYASSSITIADRTREMHFKAADDLRAALDAANGSQS